MRSQDAMSLVLAIRALQGKARMDWAADEDLLEGLTSVILKAEKRYGIGIDKKRVSNDF